MTIFTGVYARMKGRTVSDTFCSSLRQAISRCPTEQLVDYRCERFFVVKADIQAYGAPAFRVSEAGSIALLAGEPLLATVAADNRIDRDADLSQLQRAWDRDNWSDLSLAQGSFCAAYFNPSRDELSLISDKLGVRPLYYWISADYLVFATAMRILESVAEVQKRMDARGVTELVAFGYPLATRTPYENVSMLNAAAIVRVTPQDVFACQYWRWDSLAQTRTTPADATAEAQRRFTTGIARRLRGDTRTVAFLSGGLDSRCVVASLREQKAHVHSLSFGPPGTQDRQFASEVASRLGTMHIQVEETDAMIDSTSRMLEAYRTWQSSHNRAEFPPERPRLLWSGDGGSVAVGHVYLTKAIVDLMRAGSADAAISRFLKENGISTLRKLLQSEFLRDVGDVPERGIREELEPLRCPDQGRAFHLFLMLNDQRRHLARYYENIDLLRFEQHLPFFDSGFLEHILSLPVDDLLAHRFYNEWLRCFLPAVVEVPWQSYPGHAPCPLPLPHGLQYQWSGATASGASKLRGRLLASAKRLLRAHDFPKHILRRGYLRLAAAAYRGHIRDYGYAITAGETYYEYWIRCASNSNPQS